MKRKKVGLVLGGGGAKGFAHIGVLKVLEKNKIHIDYIAGTSIGAIIGMLYAKYRSAKTLENLAINTDIKELIHLKISKKGIVNITKIEEFLKGQIKFKKFQDLKIPMFITALNTTKNKERIFKKGNILQAIMASIAIPGLFKPIKIRKEEFIDGGWIEPLPISALKNSKADIIIAVNLLPNRNYDKIIKKDSHIILEIEPDVEEVKYNEFQKIKKTIKKGEQKTKEKIKEILNLVNN
jgi:NTE family protein